jgi:hypothetical protein
MLSKVKYNQQLNISSEEYEGNHLKKQKPLAMQNNNVTTRRNKCQLMETT